MAWGNGAPRGWPDTGGGSSICYVNSGSSEGVSTTTNSAFQQKLLVSFTATSGIRYHIHGYCEIFAADDEDVEAQLTLNGTEYLFSHFKNPPYADRWAQWNGGFYQSNALSGTINVAINWRNGYGAGNKSIRRARLLITQCP